MPERWSERQEAAERQVLHPGQTAAICDLSAKDQPIIGWLGALQPRLQKQQGYKRYICSKLR